MPLLVGLCLTLNDEERRTVLQAIDLLSRIDERPLSSKSCRS